MTWFPEMLWVQLPTFLMYIDGKGVLILSGAPDEWKMCVPWGKQAEVEVQR